MAAPDLPTFPDFAQKGRFWLTSAKLPAWSGYQVRGGPYGSVSAAGRSDGTVELQFAHEGRDAGSMRDIDRIRGFESGSKVSASTAAPDS